MLCATPILYTNAGRFAALWADQHNVRDIERGLELDTSRVDRAALSLDLPLVFGMDVYTLHHDPVFFRQNLDHFAAFSLFFNFPADNFNGITFTDLHFHRSLLNYLEHFRG
jgi:hypothetical protein